MYTVKMVRLFSVPMRDVTNQTSRLVTSRLGKEKSLMLFYSVQCSLHTLQLDGKQTGSKRAEGNTALICLFADILYPNNDRRTASFTDMNKRKTVVESKKAYNAAIRNYRLNQ
jgi:hypothetical protein